MMTSLPSKQVFTGKQPRPGTETGEGRRWLAQGHTASQQHHLGLPDTVPSILGVGFSLCFALGMVKFDGQCVMRDPGAGGQAVEIWGVLGREGSLLALA